MTAGVEYFDGQAWKAMSSIMPLATTRNLDSGVFLTVTTYRDTNPLIMVGQHPKFCLNASYSRNFVVVAMTVSGNHREVLDSEIRGAEVVRGRPRGGTMTNLLEQNRIPFMVKPVSDHVVEITPTQPLPAGQYIIYSTGQGFYPGGYDFGVAPGLD